MSRLGRRSLVCRLASIGAALAIFTAATLVSETALSVGSVRDLVAKLEKGVDFRVRVQAALELGKTGDKQAQRALEEALDDDNAAVRAAGAAALKVLGFRDSIKALEKHRKDPSPAVRSQVATSIDALKAIAAKKDEKPEVLIQLGKIQNGGRVKSASIDDHVARASRQKLDELPGVDLVDESSRSTRSKARKQGEPPVVMVTGRVKKLEHETQGRTIVYSASIEFVVHQMPGQAIKGVVSGSARASSDVSDSSDRAAIEDLRLSALEAAIESAMKNAPAAIRAAMR
jgi:hypothetical protein